MVKKNLSKKQKTKAPKPMFSVDKLAIQLFSCMASDFRREGFSISPRPLNWLRTDMSAFRQWSFVESMNLSTQHFKMARQMNNLLSKYTFQNDSISPEDRYKATLTGWLSDSLRIATHARIKYRTEIVLREAREIVRGVLGELPALDDIASFQKVGTRATRCCSLNHAGLDVYLSDPAAFSSSRQCLKWVKEVLLPGDAILSSLLDEVVTDPSTEGIESVVLSLVPKKWNKDRPITPIQIINLLYSYLWGKYVEIRLELAGLPISRLQERHAKIVKNQSLTLQYATVDLRGGSNNITKQHMMLLTPRRWYNTFKLCLTHSVEYKPSKVCKETVSVWTPSVLPMGNALTFPLETLYFYAIVESIRRLSGCRGFVSCYGDDLIYPSSIHKFVVPIFDDLNWAMNLDKTFVGFPFRESCGEDCYRGSAVRPFFFPDVKPAVGRMHYRRLLYQIYNGLRERWSDQSISRTLRMLRVEIAMHGEVYYVPPDYPDYAGIRTYRPLARQNSTDPNAKIICEWCPDIQNFRWTFQCLSERSVQRLAKAIPFYWDGLRQADNAALINRLRNLPEFDPLHYLVRSEVSNLRWRGFKRKVMKQGKCVRKYTVWRMYAPTKKTRLLDECTQTFYWSDVDAWCGTAGYALAC